jgi:hypothetical protein
MGDERFGGLRARIAFEAARLMYEEDVKQYFTAKRMAAKRLLGRVAGRRVRYRPSDLPSNGEIRDALLELAELAEGARRHRRLFAMRIVALETMRALAPFEPRLIGSVATGHIRRGSDIDLHVFPDDVDTLLEHLRGLGHVFTTEHVSIVKFGEIREYVHVHVADVFAIELTVYEPRELRFRPRSSTDGKPIVRLKPAALEALIAREHPEPWEAYRRDGTVAGMDERFDDVDDGDDEAPGPFDGLLDEAGAETLIADRVDEDEAFSDEPLPGFEDV